MNQQQREQAIVNRISTVGIAGNVALTAFKLFAGVAGHSGAMISDAVHSLSDVFATLIAFLGVRFSSREADQGHPYGHERRPRKFYHQPSHQPGHQGPRCDEEGYRLCH